ncbi:unnamed protein product [Agarophyton chilense]
MANETAAEFEEASQFVSSGKLTNVSQDEQLELYGLYSVVKKGSAPNQAPSALLDPIGFAKWTAWQASCHLNPEEAMEEYTKIVKNLRKVPASKSPLDNHSSGFGNKVSGGFDFYPESDNDCTEKFDICYWAAVGNTKAVVQCLKKQGVSPDYKDQDGLTPLMRAVDRNEFQIVDVLVEAGANLNAGDEDGQTALHYAVCCDHSDMVGLLLSYGARTDIVDLHGVNALNPASDETKKIVEEVKQGKWTRKNKPFNSSPWLRDVFVPNMSSYSIHLVLASFVIGVTAIAIYRLRK